MATVACWARRMCVNPYLRANEIVHGVYYAVLWGGTTFSLSISLV